jgi:ferredoxin
LEAGAVRIVVDQDRCTGHARCHAIDSELFSLDDDGYSNVTSFEVPPSKEQVAHDAVLSCPEMAIRAED